MPYGLSYISLASYVYFIQTCLRVFGFFVNNYAIVHAWSKVYSIGIGTGAVGANILSYS